MELQPFAHEGPLSFIKAKFGFPLFWNKKDICKHWNFPEGLSLQEIFQRKGIRYIPYGVGGFYERVPVFLHEINGPTRRIGNLRTFCREVLLMMEMDARIARYYFRMKYLILYENALWTASLYEEEENPGFFRGFEQNPHNKLKILQTMRELGLYNGSILSMKEICEWFFVPLDSDNKKKQICEILDIPFFYQQRGDNFRVAQPCAFRDLTTGEVLNFASMKSASRYFNIHHQIIKRYFLFGEMFHSGDRVYQS